MYKTYQNGNTIGTFNKIHENQVGQIYLALMQLRQHALSNVLINTNRNKQAKIPKIDQELIDTEIMEAREILANIPVVDKQVLRHISRKTVDMLK